MYSEKDTCTVLNYAAFVVFNIPYSSFKPNTGRTPGFRPQGDKRIHKFETEILCWKSNYETSVPEEQIIPTVPSRRRYE